MKMFLFGTSTKRNKIYRQRTLKQEVDGIYCNLLMKCIVSVESKSIKTAKNSQPFSVGKFLDTSIR